MKQSTVGFTLDYYDTGKGFKLKDTDLDKKGVGQGLIGALVKQIGATIFYHEAESFHCTITAVIG